jgi:Flp pilus assembly protein TadD
MAYSMLASTYVDDKRPVDAERWIRAALEAHPRDPYAHTVLSALYRLQGDNQRAVKATRMGILQDKSDDQFWAEYATGLDLIGEHDLAARAYRRAMELQPNNAIHRGKLAAMLAKKGEFDEAMTLWREAIEISPDISNFRFGYGLALVVRGEMEQGLGELRKAVELNPQKSDPMRHLAWILATHSDSRWHDGPEAVRLAEQAVRASERPTAELLDTVAAANARAGNWSVAVSAAEQAVQLAEIEGRPDLVERIRHRLALYKSRQAFPPSN